MRSVKRSPKDQPYMSPLLEILIQKHKQKSARGTHKLKKTERRIQDTIIANIESSKNKPGSASCWKITMYMLGKKKMLNSVGLRRGRDESIFRRYLPGRGLSASEQDSNSRNATTGGLAASRVLRTTKKRDIAPGKDGIPAWVFGENANNFKFPLKHIRDQCLAQRKFPAGPMKSKSFFLPKVATPGSLIDFRPTAITPIMSRIMEKNDQKFRYQNLRGEKWGAPTWIPSRRIYGENPHTTAEWLSPR